MQKGRVLSIKSFGILEFFKNNSFLIIVTVIFTIGFFIGIFSINSFSYLKGYSTDYIAEYISLRSDTSFGSIFISSFFGFLSELFVLFLLGASLFGIITVPAAMLIKGITLGGVTAYLYSTFSLKGIAFNAVIIIPPTLVFLIILLLCTRESVRFSIKLSRYLEGYTFPTACFIIPSPKPKSTIILSRELESVAVPLWIV